MKTILRTLVGSRAHGLHNEDSDYDYRGVFIQSTSDLLSLNSKARTTNWIEGEEDNTSYELSHFLSLACRSNPSVLEVLVSPVIEETKEGSELRELLPYLWSSEGVYNAFGGYSHNQRKKFVDNKDSWSVQEGIKGLKFAVASIRVMNLGIELLEKGTMTVSTDGSYLRSLLLTIKRNGLSHSQILDYIIKYEKYLETAYNNNKHKVTDYNKVNEYLLKIKKDNWVI